MKTREGKTGERLSLKEEEYFTGIGDGSYFSCINPTGKRATLKQMILPTALYDTTVEAISKIGTPCFYIGSPVSGYSPIVGARILLDLEGAGNRIDGLITSLE